MAIYIDNIHVNQGGGVKWPGGGKSSLAQFYLGGKFGLAQFYPGGKSGLAQFYPGVILAGGNSGLLHLVL